MKVFISWSGEQSKLVAQALHDWLPTIVPGVHPWMSDRDIGAGERWSEEIESQLRASGFGIICVTKGNRQAPWLNFEAGAIANNLSEKGDGKARVVPYLLDLGFADLSGPLTQFHGKQADEVGTRELVQAINTLINTHPPSVLEKMMNAFWGELEVKLEAARRNHVSETQITHETAEVPRSPEDKLDEVLLLLREVAGTLGERPNRPSSFSALDLIGMEDIDERTRNSIKKFADELKRVSKRPDEAEFIRTPNGIRIDLGYKIQSSPQTLEEIKKIVNVAASFLLSSPVDVSVYGIID